MWNHDVSDAKEVERMVSLYAGDGTCDAGPGTEAETDWRLVRNCANEFGMATWEAFRFERDSWASKTFSNREAAEIWLDGCMDPDRCEYLDHLLTQSLMRIAAYGNNMSDGRWTAGIHEYRDGRKSLSFQLQTSENFFLVNSPISKPSELATGKVRDHVREVLADLDPYREAMEACRRAEDSSIALGKLAFYEKLKNEDMPVLLGAISVATEQNQRALGNMLADTKFVDMFKLPEAINPMEAAVAEAQGKLMEWMNSDRDYSRYYCDDASVYLTEYSDIGRDIMVPLLRLIDELVDDGTLDEVGVHENPVAAIGSMLAEAALEHARADLEYFDQDFRYRAVDGINGCAVARTIAEAVPAAKPAEEEPAQSRGPKR